MQLKANVHMHTSDDPADVVSYSIYEAIDRASELGFDVLAITCHGKVAWTESYAQYAQERGILLISGIELSISKGLGKPGKHVLLLGAIPQAESVRTFAELRAYRVAHPESLIIAPHPYFYGNFSLHDELEQHIDVFDAIEHSWFYGGPFNRNVHAREIAERYRKPFIATSDTHMLDHLEQNFSILEVAEKSEQDVLNAIRSGSFSIQTRPSKLLSEMLLPQALFSLRTLAARLVGVRCRQ